MIRYRRGRAFTSANDKADCLVRSEGSVDSHDTCREEPRSRLFALDRATSAFVDPTCISEAVKQRDTTK
jgi:hypothetical protein